MPVFSTWCLDFRLRSGFLVSIIANQQFRYRSSPVDADDLWYSNVPKHACTSLVVSTDATSQQLSMCKDTQLLEADHCYSFPTLPQELVDKVVYQAIFLSADKATTAKACNEDGDVENEKADNTLTNWLPLHITGAFCSLHMLVMRIQPLQCSIFKDIISHASLTIKSICITWVNWKNVE
ncbi:hypothetical protein ARMGADRAFT_1028432 [Armillaria gallica]|uniref:Uncharacterized protein n=1 Tax=Armillaria gallica TaxID=47427 RepID=A0A2H3DM20_ARMGA|nr:hypothetical protein ARMGADRAFT_1028432 [Armillaria gallica]